MDARSEWLEVGSRIREARTLCEMTQETVAVELGIDRTAVMRIESGERKVSALELFQLATLFEVPMAHFVLRPRPEVVSRRSLAADESDASARAVWRLGVALDEYARAVAQLAQAKVLAGVDFPSLEKIDLESPSAAQQAARHARLQVSLPSGPLGDLADVCARWGLYLLVVDQDVDGASIQIDELPGLGAAVIGGRHDPGRRRFTAAHELGHHLLRDPYSSDVGLAASVDPQERLIDAFAQEFLLPEADLRAAVGHSGRDKHATLVEVAAKYRVSWSMVVRAARQCGVVDDPDAVSLAARKPTRGDFLGVMGREPVPDLLLGATSAQWRQAVLSAYKQTYITDRRAVELLYGAINSVDDLPSGPRMTSHGEFAGLGLVGAVSRMSRRSARCARRPRCRDRRWPCPPCHNRDRCGRVGAQ